MNIALVSIGRFGKMRTVIIRLINGLTYREPTQIDDLSNTLIIRECKVILLKEPNLNLLLERGSMGAINMKQAVMVFSLPSEGIEKICLL